MSKSKGSDFEKVDGRSQEKASDTGRGQFYSEQPDSQSSNKPPPAPDIPER